MKHSVFAVFCSLFCAFSVSLSAQEIASTDALQTLSTAPTHLKNVASPIINDDGSATIRLYAPNAHKVMLKGDCLQKQHVVPMLKDSKGWWQYTTKPLEPDLYSYNIIVDSVLGIDPSSIYMNRNVNQYYNYFIITHEKGDDGYLCQVHDVPHGNIHKVWYDSPTLQMQRRMTVYTPPTYDNGDRFPVLYLLHGSGGDEDAWNALGRCAQIMDNLIAMGKAKPMIVVMPNGNADCSAAPGQWGEMMYEPDFTPTPTGKTAPATFEQAFPDIIRYVDTHFRTFADREHRAVSGLSMGGAHTFNIARLYPTLFNHIALFSAAFSIDGRHYSLPNFYDALTSDKQCVEQLRQLFASRPKHYWIMIGKDDFLYEPNKQLRQYFDEQNYPYTYFETRGEHIWMNWRRYLAMFAQAIF